MNRNDILKKEQIVQRVNDLLNNNTGKYSKYERNYCLYNQTPTADLKGKIPVTVGYMDDIYSDETSIPKLNIIKSCVDAVVSKISTAHCRPFVNTIKGSFKTIQVCKQLQVFYDYYFDEEDIQSKVVQALRDACVFDSGFIFLNEDDGKIINCKPWNVFTRQTEQNYFKSFYVEFPNQSIDSLNDIDYELLTEDEKKLLYVRIGYFYDSRTKTKATLINRVIRDIKELQSDTMPLIPIYYTMPIAGNSTMAITDMLKGIQIEVDSLMRVIAEASALNPGMTIYLANASNIKVGQLNNKIGNIVQYDSPQGSSPVEHSTPDFISNQYMNTLDNLIEKAYNLVGISQLSAQGKKPTGLNSGVALATQNDIESDRFQVLLDQYIKMFTDIAKVITKVFTANKTLIKPNRYNLRLTWADVNKEYDKMRIQFSCADSLSKDPSEKLKQLQTLAQAGIIPATQIASLLELPDINRAYSVANNAFNAAMTLIDQVIYEDKFEIPSYVPYQMLKEQILSMEMSLCAANQGDQNNEDIQKLQKYYQMIEDQEMDLEQQQKEVSAVDTNLNNMYSKLNSGTEDNLNMNNEGVANPYSTDMEVSE